MCIGWGRSRNRDGWDRLRFGSIACALMTTLNIELFSGFSNPNLPCRLVLIWRHGVSSKSRSQLLYPRGVVLGTAMHVTREAWLVCTGFLQRKWKHNSVIHEHNLRELFVWFNLVKYCFLLDRLRGCKTPFAIYSHSCKIRGQFHPTEFVCGSALPLCESWTFVCSR